MNFQSTYEENVTWPAFQAAVDHLRTHVEEVSATKVDTVLIDPPPTRHHIDKRQVRSYGINIFGPNATLPIDGGLVSNLPAPQERKFELENTTWHISSSTNSVKEWLDGMYSVEFVAAHSFDSTATTIIPEVQVLSPNPLAGYEEYAKPNWDFYGAEPITAETVEAARWFLTILPATLGEPHISPGADGTIGLEWVFNDDRPLRKLFIDIGPFYVWGGYWRLASGERHTIRPKPIDVGTEAELVELFRTLSA